MDQAVKWVAEHRIHSTFEVVVFYKSRPVAVVEYDGPDHMKATMIYGEIKLRDNVEIIHYRINGQIVPDMSYIAQEDKDAE